MQQPLQNNRSLGGSDSRRKITFSTRPYDPPSSPPPDSPLPPLPEIAFSVQGSPTSPSSASRYLINKERPVRPPRPQVSLPELKPRIIRSPDLSERQTYSKNVAQTRLSPTPFSRRQTTLRNEYGARTTAEHPNSHRLSTPKQLNVSTFSDDVFGALPRLLNRLSPVQSRCDESRFYEGQHDRAGPRGVDHRSLATASSKPTQSPVARTALFIPRTPPGTPPTSNDQLLPSSTCSLKVEDTSHVTQNNQRSIDASGHSNRSKPLFEPPRHPNCASHKRSLAVTSFEPDLGWSFDSYSWPRSSIIDEDLTSLPRVPSHPVLLIRNTSVKPKDKNAIADLFRPPESIRSLETDSLATLPYSHTRQNAGPVPKTEADNIDHDNTLETEEIGVEGARPLTEEEMRVLKQKRILWAIATISLVVIATSGILIGIVWKLRSLA